LEASRRAFLKAGAFGLVPALLAGCASPPGRTNLGKVVIVGAGYGGATAAKYQCDVHELSGQVIWLSFVCGACCNRA